MINILHTYNNLVALHVLQYNIRRMYIEYLNRKDLSIHGEEHSSTLCHCLGQQCSPYNVDQNDTKNAIHHIQHQSGSSTKNGNGSGNDSGNNLFGTPTTTGVEIDVDIDLDIMKLRHDRKGSSIKIRIRRKRE